MGSSIDSWNDVANMGAYYSAAFLGESGWLFVSMALCVLALVVGARHELSSYAKAEKK